MVELKHMEIVCTLNKRENLEKYINAGANAILFGSAFSLRFNYSSNELRTINSICIANNVKRYISIDALISENDRSILYEYMDVLKELAVDGIYFSDLGVIAAATKLGLKAKLIYDPDTLITNSLDASFFIKQGIDVVLARELSYEEVEKILNNNPEKVDMQIFGHLRMSYSKRKFLTNYFNYIGKAFDPSGRKDLRLVEETRNYKLPIIEDEFGSRIYSDYCLLMYEELAKLKPLIKRAIIDDTFIECDVICEAIKDIKRLDKDNAEFFKLTLKNKHREINFSNGYLDTKTTKTKEENE